MCRLPAFAPRSDPAVLLASVADALNALERTGIIADLDHGALSCKYGYVVPVGDGRLGHRWAVRTKTEQRGEVMPNADSQ